MFNRAVSNYRAPPPPSAKPTAPPPPAKQASIQSMLGKKPMSFTPKPQTFKPQTLKPTQVALPSNVPQSLGVSSEPRKRPLAALSNNGSFQENLPPVLDVNTQSSLSALHEAVYFDEADFEDDNDLDFDIPEPPINRVLKAAAASAELAHLPPTPDEPRMQSNSAANIHPPLSSQSAPLPWSSSPVEHHSTRQRPPDRGLQPKNKEHLPSVEEFDDVKPTKRRRLPWKKGDDGVKAENKAEAEPITENQGLRDIEAKIHGSHQRGTKESSSRSLPFNDAQSFKNAQKDLRRRNGQKRSMSTTVTNPVDDLPRKRGAEPLAKIFLTEEQRHILKIVKEGKSVFFTGSAGTGKSVLLREIINVLKEKHKKDGDRVAVTASTGLAACNVGGVTIHSFSGIGLGKEECADLVRKIKKNQKARMRWMRTKVLIIDEVSMVDGDLFDKLEAIARNIRNNARAFGGLQLIITGDFFQLPPVPDSGKIAKFAFDADTWNTVIDHTIGLTQVFRQKDPDFARMLNDMRLGVLSNETVRVFEGLSRPLPTDDGFVATELFATRQEVDGANNNQLKLIDSESMKFLAEDGGTITEKTYRDRLLSNCMAPPTIELKVGAQVMLIKNMDESLVNGSLGRVVAFSSEKGWAEIDSLIDDGDRKRIYELKSKAVDTARRWPVVEFSNSDGSRRQILCVPETWKIELPSGEIQAQRSQVPLILAWALSIHKAQGQTLEKVKVDLGRVFERGQAYVALSRATKKEGLQVLRFKKDKVMAHEKVRKFYAGLYSASEAAKRKMPPPAKSRSNTPMLNPPRASSAAAASGYPDSDEEEMMMAMETSRGGAKGRVGATG